MPAGLVFGSCLACVIHQPSQPQPASEDSAHSAYTGSVLLVPASRETAPILAQSTALGFASAINRLLLLLV